MTGGVRLCVFQSPGSPDTSAQSQCGPSAPAAASAPSGCSARPAESSPEPPVHPAHIIIHLQFSAALSCAFLHRQDNNERRRLKIAIIPNEFQLFTPYFLFFVHFNKVCASDCTHCIKLFPFIDRRRGAGSHLRYIFQLPICLTCFVFFLN